jgi:hypothetical protein
MQFDKWYFDIQNDQFFGYYYVGFIRFLGLCLSFTEVHQIWADSTTHYFHTGLGYEKKLRSFSTSQARIWFEKNYTELRIRQNKNVISGRWSNNESTLPQIKRPVYKNKYGSCNWKIWMPQGDVRVKDESYPQNNLTGKGYIDFVRLTIPIWKLPFRVLHWGRLYSEFDWIVLFHLQTTDTQVFYMADKYGWHSGSHIDVHKNNNAIHSFIWSTKDDRMEIIPVKKIQQNWILNPERNNWIPGLLQEKLSSGGYEEKYKVEAIYHDNRYTGIMEEVRWNVC